MYIKIRISKAIPGRAEDYARDKNILKNEIRRNLFISTLPPATEMIKTAHSFGKWMSESERKTFSIVFSPDPKDRPTPEHLEEVIEATLDHFFPNHQCIIVLHKDKFGTADQRKNNPVLHGHVYGSIIDPITGKNMHLSPKNMIDIRSWVDAYCKDHFNWTPLQKTHERKAHSRYSYNVLRAMKAKKQYSWKAEMLSKIERHFDSAESYEDFIKKLDLDGIGAITKRNNRKTKEAYLLPELMFSYIYKGKTMVVKGSTLSPKFTRMNINSRFYKGGKNYVRSERRSTYTQTAIRPKGMDSGPVAGQQPRQNSGQRHIRVNVGKIDFECIDCTHQKDICDQCRRHENYRGDIRNARTR